MKKLIFVDSKEQVKSIAKLFDNQTTIISLNPSANSELIRNELPHDTSIKYFGNRGHIEIFKTSNEIITLLRNEFYLEDSVGVTHAYEITFFYYFRNYYLHYLLAYLQIIHNAVQKVKPDIIILPRTTNPAQIGVVLTDGRSLLGYIGGQYAKQYGYKVKEVGSSIVLSKKIDQHRIVKWANRILFKFQLFIYQIITKDKNIIFGTHPAYNLPRVLKQIGRQIKRPFLVGERFTSIYEYLLSAITGEHWKFVKFPPLAPKRLVNEFVYAYDSLIKKFDKLIDNNEKIFTFHGVNMKVAIMDYLRNSLKDEVINTLHQSHAFEKIINVSKPFFAISNQATGGHYAFGELCRIHKVPAMLISHGTHVPHDDFQTQIECDELARYMINSHYPLVAVQTPWAEKFLNSQNEVFSKPVLTGPLLYSQNNLVKDQLLSLRAKLFPTNHHKKILLHAATPFGWYFLLPWINLTHDEYIKHINDLIQAVEKMEGVFLAIRIRLKSFPRMKLHDIKRLFIDSNCYELYTEGSFEDFLISSDLLVSFSSTTIEEALQNKIPVLQYDPFDRYCHIPAQKLAQEENIKLSPIYYLASFPDLKWGIQWIKDNHLNNKDSKNLDWSEHILNPDNEWLGSITRDNQLYT